MVKHPIPPRVRLEQRVLARCKDFYRMCGTDAHTPAGMQQRAAIWALTGSQPTRSAFEEVLAELAKRDRLDSNSLTLACGSLDVHPSDPDYAATKAEHIQVQDGLILTAVRALIPQQ